MRDTAPSWPIDVTAVLSTLHEPPGRCTASRLFRGESVLTWTLRRLAGASRIARVAVLCWEDQQPLVGPIAEANGAFCSVRSPRIALPQIETVAAARRWADGWRGGLFASCEFDRGFHGAWIAEIREKVGGDAVLLIDPSAALVDGQLLDNLIDHAAANPGPELVFSQAAPGLSGVLIRKTTLGRLAAARIHPGTTMSYLPDIPMRDPLTSPSCAPVPASLARTTLRFTLDSKRQIEQISLATDHLNGELMGTQAEQLLHSLMQAPPSKFPREIMLELTTRRISRPIYWPGRHLKIERPDLSLETANQVLDEISADDGIRLFLGGVGDPLLHPHLFEIVAKAHAAGIPVAMETDLLGIEQATIDRLADSPIDIVSVIIPAGNAKSYQAVMGFDGVKMAMENLARLIDRRKSVGRGTPLIAPTFIKTNINLAEMEPCYDHWLRQLNCAVITGPSDYAGQIPDCSVAQMEPPRRRACARLSQRLTILCDGQVVSCEQDVLARQPLGRVGRDFIAAIWAGAAAKMRNDHAAGHWDRHPLCAACKDWHRP
jgi:hypothetical protein